MSPRFLVALACLAGCSEAASDPSAPAPTALPRAPVSSVYTARAAAPPCAGCTLDVPERTDAIPLLVVLHGDRESAPDAADRWRTVALPRGFAVLSLACPCEQRSWWMWGGAPAWVDTQVAAVARDHAIDPARTYLVGWSGGASFVGMHAPAWGKFAAAVYHGGGQPPTTSDACPRAPLPAYFLVGDRNPSHASAQKLRAYYERCGQALTWDLVAGGDHAAEDAALHAAKAAAILDWLERHARVSS